MVGEVQRDITLLFENNILNSNHVQYDNEDDACALKSIFLYAFAHVHHYGETLMIIGSEGKQSLEGFLNLTIYVYTLLSLTYSPTLYLRDFWEMRACKIKIR